MGVQLTIIGLLVSMRSTLAIKETTEMLYRYIGNLTPDQLQAKLGLHHIDGDVMEASNGQIVVETDEDDVTLTTIFGFDLKPVAPPKRKRAKNVGTVEIVEIINSDGTPEEIARETGYGVSTVKRYLPFGSSERMADTWRMGFLMHRLFEAGAIPDDTPEALWNFLPEDGEIGAVIGLKHWRKCKAVVHRMRATMIETAEAQRQIAELERQNAGLDILVGSMKRAAGH